MEKNSRKRERSSQIARIESGEKCGKKNKTNRLVEETIRKEQQAKYKENNESNINDVCVLMKEIKLRYEAWKLRELKRIIRDREAIEK